MGKILGAWRIISVTAICNRQRDIQRWRRIALRSSGRTRFVRAPGGGKGRDLQGPSGAAAGFPPIPAGTGQRYSKRSQLTVLLRQQVQNCLLARLWLILAGPMASGMQTMEAGKWRNGKSAT